MNGKRYDGQEHDGTEPVIPDVEQYPGADQQPNVGRLTYGLWGGILEHLVTTYLLPTRTNAFLQPAMKGGG